MTDKTYQVANMPTTPALGSLHVDIEREFAQLHEQARQLKRWGYICFIFSFLIMFSMSFASQFLFSPLSLTNLINTLSGLTQISKAQNLLNTTPGESDAENQILLNRMKTQLKQLKWLNAAIIIMIILASAITAEAVVRAHY